MNSYQKRLQNQIYSTINQGLKDTEYVSCPICQKSYSDENYCGNCGLANLRVDKITRPDLIDQIAHGQEQLKNRAMAGHSKFSKWFLEYLRKNELLVLTTDKWSEYKFSSYVKFYGSLFLFLVVSYFIASYLGVVTTILTGLFLIYFYRRFEFEKVVTYIPTVFLVQLIGALVFIFSQVSYRVEFFTLQVVYLAIFDIALLSSCLYSTSQPAVADKEKQSTPLSLQTETVDLSRGSVQNPSAEFHYQHSASSSAMNILLFLIVYIPLGIGAQFVSNVTGGVEIALGLFLIVGVGLAIYLLPTFISGTNRKIMIFFFNVIFGVTIIGWILLLFLALDGNSKERQRQEMNHILNKMADKY